MVVSTGSGGFLSESAIASSHGAGGESRASYAYVYCSPVAEADGQLQTASWSDTRRKLSRLQPPEEVGRTAARRAARMLGARKPKTQRVPVVFEPQLAAGFIGRISSAVDRLLGHKKSCFLASLLGKRVASAQGTMVVEVTLEHAIANRHVS